MSFMDELRRLARPYEDDDDFLDEDLEEPFAEPREDRKARRKREDRDDDLDTGYTSVNNDKVVNINTTTQLQVVLVKPERFDNVSEIADHLRDKHSVLLNLENTDRNIARRLVDFLSGCAYAVDGKIKKVAASAYLLTPYNVEIVGDLVEELENNGVYF